jgi:hypothetical protein
MAMDIVTIDFETYYDKDYHWTDIKVTPPPRGPKMLLIHKGMGVAVLRSWRESDTWTHWCPLPTFKKDDV